MGTYLIISDIHGNLSALNSILASVRKIPLDGILLLGDLIDYGMRSNEVIKTLASLPDPVLVNLWGNHEQAILMNDYSRFSSERGKQSAMYTCSHLNEMSITYLNAMTRSGMQEFSIEGKSCLAVHGCLADSFWKSIEPDNLRGDYRQYELVLSGHSHVPHYFVKFYPSDNERLRNKKAVRFLNPGSAGQPRDESPFAKCALLDMDTMEAQLLAIAYPIKEEQALFTEEIDAFYSERLELGI